MTSGLRAFRLTAALCIVAAASACGHGGSSSGMPPADRTVVPFTSFQALIPGQTVGMQGTSQTSSGAQAVIVGTTTVTSVDLPAANAGGIELGFDESRTLRTIKLSSPQSTVSFDRAAVGNSIVCGGGTCTASSPTATATVMDPFAQGWNYQTFGVWNVLGNPSSWQVGAVIAGNQTPPGALPPSGNATFTGFAHGFYVDVAGNRFSTAANMTANVDWTVRTVGFSTANTTLTNVNTQASLANAGLNLTGNLPFQGPLGSTSFSGTVNTANGDLTGTSTGFFFGPNGQEIGGTYRLTTPARAAGANSTDLPSMVGAFGGKR